MTLYQPPDPGHEPHKVSIKRDELQDPGRNGRIVPFKLYYPVAHSLARLPVVVWSHGLGGGRDGAAFLARFVASHGYVVINIQHPGTDTGLWEGKPGHPWDVIRDTHIPRSASLDRFGDVPFLLDSLPAWLGQNPEIAEHIDLSVVGMCGHSFGALTTQVMAGQPFPDENNELKSFRDGRFRAGILYSPIPIGHLRDDTFEKLYGPISLPLLHMTGTDDKSPISGWGYERRLVVYNNAGNGAQHLCVLEDGDHMVFAGSRGKLADNPKRHEHEAIIKVISLAWWDAYLKDSVAARDWLTGGGAGDWLRDRARYEVREEP